MPNQKEYTGKVEKKLLPDSLAGKSYKKNNMKVEWIVIHNTDGANKVSSPYNHFSQGADGAYTATQYAIDDTTILQMLEDNWSCSHCGPVRKGNYGADRGASNSNSIGIEVCDGPKCDKNKAVELTIELARYLCKKHSVPVDNVIQHNHVSGKDCPKWIRANNKWDYIKQEIKRRNEEQVPINFDSSTLDSSGASTSGGTLGNYDSTLPNFDNREDKTNIAEIKGVVLVHMPPYHFYSIENKENAWSKDGYSKDFHYLLDSTGMTLSKDKNLVAMSLQPNDRHTYIDRALFGNKSYKYTLNMGLFTSEMLEDYTVTEKKMIEELSKILYENNLKTKNLWREFDLNRAPSPFMYLDREQWKLLLREVDKQVEWRYANFGEPELPEEEPLNADNEVLMTHIGSTGNCNRRCTLRQQPNMTGPHVKVLDEGTPVKIIDYQKGYYKVEAGAAKSVGWIVYKSVKVSNAESAVYTVRSKDNGIPQPEIIPTMTHEEYLIWKSYTDPKIIDEFAGSCEPYDKGLPEILEAPITNDDRLTALTKELKTDNENTIYYSVVEGSPGGDGHCVRPAGELSMLYKPDPFKVDPIYPDLIVPPNYSTADNSVGSKNPIPMVALGEGLIKEGKDFDNNDLSFDFDLLAEMNKKSKGKPINYLDPYPFDDKVFELEKHSPKVKIDEIEARLYESNHPGDPMPHPVAKNFAMINDALINQSKKVESRLVRLENTLAFVLRSLGRVGSRVNINCVYYGGQDVFGKYKTIRCLRDDRIHDACSVTLDQCLSCTRYEPVIGQIYEILDDTGMNGSVMLDQMQMSYMDLEQYKALNRVEKRSTKQKFAYVHTNKTDKPSLITEEWEQADKEKYLESLKSKITDTKEYEEAVNNIKKEDYAFMMNWYEQDLDLQEPDVKAYPTEGIKAKYKNTDIEDNVSEKPQAPDTLLDDTDKDYTDDVDKLNKLNQGEWVDTREEADTYEENKYSSENFYFEDFNKDSLYIEGAVGGMFGAECRNKIVEMAKMIVQDHDNLKASYDQNNGNRTINYENKVYKSVPRVNPNEKIAIYDCSSFTSCCYNYAGLKSIYGKNTTAIKEELDKNGGKTWSATTESVKDALPGDLIWHPGHVGIYIGDNKVAHAANKNYPKGKDIKIEDLSHVLKYSFNNNPIFARPKDLIEADATAAQMSTTINMDMKDEITVNGTTYKAAKIQQAVVTAYYDNGNYAKSNSMSYVDIRNNKTVKVPTATEGKNQMRYCASHNLPYGTQVYIPDLAQKGIGDGIFTVVDTGGHFFDFDIHVPNAYASKIGKGNHDVYILRPGTGTAKDAGVTASYTYIANYYKRKGQWPKLVSAWNTYQKMNGKLIHFHQFNQEDKLAQVKHPVSPIGN
jgi:N-acetylmuramoyl-L-alanine amidase CwlA